MGRTYVRTSALLLLLAAVTAWPVVATPRAQAAACVTVVVRGGHRCVAAGGNGITVLKRAGHTVRYAPSFPGFVCQIDGYPTRCTNPTANYWGYFHAQPGKAWTYSSVGATSRTPAAGTCEGWRFEYGGATTPPRYRCPAAS